MQVPTPFSVNYFHPEPHFYSFFFIPSKPTLAMQFTPQSVTVGVTDGAMNRKKTLCELIEPIQTRIDAVRDFILEIKPTVEAKVVPIQDPFGPSTVDPRLQAIVVSQVCSPYF